MGFYGDLSPVVPAQFGVRTGAGRVGLDVARGFPGPMDAPICPEVPGAGWAGDAGFKNRPDPPLSGCQEASFKSKIIEAMTR